MLTRLVKYDLKKLLKFLGAFIILSLFFGILKRIFGKFDSLAWNIVSGICNGTAISMMCSLLINCMMRSWVTFCSSLYGDESYLTHTLPVKRETHYAAKAVTAAVGLFVGMVVVLVTLFILYWSEGTRRAISGIIDPVSAYLNLPAWSIVSFFLIVLYLELFNFIQIGFSGLILGHRLNSSKLLLSVVFGFAIYMATQAITLIGMFIIGLINSDFMKIFSTGDLMNMKPGVIVAIALTGAGFYLLFCVAGFFINRHLLKKGVNVD